MLCAYETRTMSKVLIIRHLPSTLSFQDKEQLLKHFGAEKVWETKSKRPYVFASFADAEKAKSSLLRLHQLKIARRRLVVEYSIENEPVSQKSETEQTSAVTKHVAKFLRVLNAWNPSVDFYQPPPVQINYKYPDIDCNIIVNIIYSLLSHNPFYIQTLHLMNKMCLDVPFQENDKAQQHFREMFKSYFLHEVVPVPSIPPETEESEISSDDNEKQQCPASVSMKRLHTLPKTRKRPSAILSTASLPKIRKAPVNQEQVFENVEPLQESRKILVVVAQDALLKQQEEPEVVGQLGKFQKEEQPEIIMEMSTDKEQPAITRKELLTNRISYRDMKILPVFKNYHPGQPSMRLYIKNLAKTVNEHDVKRIYKHYIKHLTDEDVGFDVRVMQEGKMKGQAFVTFPSMDIAETALHETNGYMLKERPMVVQFARVANKKTIE